MGAISVLEVHDRSYAPAWECSSGRSASGREVMRSVTGCMPTGSMGTINQPASIQLKHLGQDDLGAFHLFDDDAQAFDFHLLFFFRHPLEGFVD